MLYFIHVNKWIPDIIMLEFLNIFCVLLCLSCQNVCAITPEPSWCLSWYNLCLNLSHCLKSPMCVSMLELSLCVLMSKPVSAGQVSVIMPKLSPWLHHCICNVCVARFGLSGILLYLLYYCMQSVLSWYSVCNCVTFLSVVPKLWGSHQVWVVMGYLCVTMYVHFNNMVHISLSWHNLYAIMFEHVSPNVNVVTVCVCVNYCFSCHSVWLYVTTYELCICIYVAVLQ